MDVHVNTCGYIQAGASLSKLHDKSKSVSPTEQLLLQRSLLAIHRGVHKMLAPRRHTVLVVCRGV